VTAPEFSRAGLIALLREADALLAEAQAAEDAARDHRHQQVDPEFQVRVSPKGSIATRKLYR